MREKTGNGIRRFVAAAALASATAPAAAAGQEPGGAPGQHVRLVHAATAPAAAAGQEPGGRVEMAATTRGAESPELRRFDGLVDALARTGELALVSRLGDRYLPGRAHEGFMQFHQGVPVLGGGVSRQLAGGVAVSIFGTIHEDVDVDTAPRISADEALAVIAEQTDTGPAGNAPPTLVILPTLSGARVLAWRAAMRDLRTYFVDAHRGVVVRDESAADEQHGAAVGSGDGILGQSKKLSTSRAGGVFQAHDRLRPAEIVTLDLRHDDELLDRLTAGDRPWVASDVASDADNEWDDAAVVDGHAYAGFTYDYFARQGWSGMDGRNGRLLNLVNVGRGYANAFFAPPPYGPEGTGMVAFGELRNGTPLVPADVVAHEIMHGVTWFSVRQRTGEPLRDLYPSVPGPSKFTLPGGLAPACGTRYRYLDDVPPRSVAGRRVHVAGRVFRFDCGSGRRLLLRTNHGGAVNEAFSDVIGTAVEFALHDPPSGPLRADYLISEDTGGVLRSLADPRSLPIVRRSPIPYPDAYERRILFLTEVFEDDGRAYFSNVGSVDGGRTLTLLPSWGYDGEHWNATILGHAFHLAIEGGRNRTTGLTVQGVGGANRGDVESAFFRAMTHLMPSAANLPTAADVIRQSAADLSGAGSATYRAIDEALRAVGLAPR